MKPGQKVEVKWTPTTRLFPGHVDSIAGATGAVLSLLRRKTRRGNYVKVVQRVPVKIISGPDSTGQGHLRPGMKWWDSVHELTITI